MPLELGEGSYGILHTAEQSCFVVVRGHVEDKSGNLYQTDESGSSLALSLRNVHYEQGRTASITKIHGLEGVYMANTMFPGQQLDAQDGAEENAPQLQTKITFNKGGTWQFLIPPAVDAEAHPYNNAGHLHLFFDGNPEGRTAVYSTAASTGLILGVGFVAEVYSEDIPDEELGLYISRDGGHTWKEIRKGPYVFEVANFGAVLVAASQNEPTDHIIYSLDEGDTWGTISLLDQTGVLLLKISNIRTDPGFKSTKFVIIAEKENGEAVVLPLEFADIHERECHGADAPGEAQHTRSVTLGGTIISSAEDCARAQGRVTTTPEYYGFCEETGVHYCGPKKAHDVPVCDGATICPSDDSFHYDACSPGHNIFNGDHLSYVGCFSDASVFGKPRIDGSYGGSLAPALKVAKTVGYSYIAIAHTPFTEDSDSAQIAFSTLQAKPDLPTAQCDFGCDAGPGPCGCMGPQCNSIPHKTEKTANWAVWRVEHQTEQLTGIEEYLSDYEIWLPRGPDVGQDKEKQCLLGRSVSYVRRKQTSKCWSPSTFAPHVEHANCECVSSDFECEEGYQPLEDDKTTCVVQEDGTDAEFKKDMKRLFTDHNLLAALCKKYPEYDTLTAASGHRRIPGDSCVGGLELHLDKELDCQREARAGVSISTVVLAVAIVAAVTGGVFFLNTNKPFHDQQAKYSLLPNDASDAAGLSPESVFDGDFAMAGDVVDDDAL